MTEPRRGPAGEHLDLDALADVLAGERPDDPHLQACATCADRLTELQAAEVAVVASLATLPEPVLPEGLAERLAAALRAEPPLAPAEGLVAGRDRDRPAVRATAGAPRTVTPLRRRRRTWLPPVAAAGVLVLAGGLAWSGLQDAGTRTADTAASAGGGAEQDSSAEGGADAGGAAAATRNDSGIDYADEGLRTATLPSVLAGTATALRTVRSASPASPTSPSSPDGPSPAALADAPPSSGPGADPLARLRDPAALESCLSALRPPQEPDQRPLALDYARFGDRPALAVVLPDRDPAKLSLVVVGAGCSAADDQALLSVRPDRP